MSTVGELINQIFLVNTKVDIIKRSIWPCIHNISIQNYSVVSNLYKGPNILIE